MSHHEWLLFFISR